MRRGILLATSIALGCASKPAPKVCSAEAPPSHEKGPVSIGMCTNDGPPPSSDAGASDAIAAEGGELPGLDAGPASSAKSASIR